jgi:hypothetical protein
LVCHITGTAQDVGEEGDKDRRMYKEVGGNILMRYFIICT